MPRKFRPAGPATGGAMTSCGGGATEFYNLSGAPGDPISERFNHDGKLQPGSPIPIPAPGGQQGVDNKRRDKPGTTGGISSTPSGPVPGTPGGSGGGYGGGGFNGSGGRPTK